MDLSHTSKVFLVALNLRVFEIKVVNILLCTVLGPLLFLLYINDITDNIQSNIRLFADCIVYRTIRSQDDSCKMICLLYLNGQKLSR